MKNNRKGYEVFEEIIFPDNVMRMGELLALQSLKFMCGHKQLHRMYANLARDIDYKDIPGYILTDSYDLAQSAALFLLDYMGKSVYDTCIDKKSNKVFTIKRLCYKHLCHLLYEEWKLKRYTGSIEDLNKSDLNKSEEPYTEFEQECKGDYTKYDKIMRKLKLNRCEFLLENIYN